MYPFRSLLTRYYLGSPKAFSHLHQDPQGLVHHLGGPVDVLDVDMQNTVYCRVMNTHPKNIPAAEEPTLLNLTCQSFLQSCTIQQIPAILSMLPVLQSMIDQ